MNRTHINMAGLLCVLLLGGCNTVTPPLESISGERLAACTAKDSMFDGLKFDKWVEKYHKTVADVVQAHEDTLKNTKTQKLQCSAPDYPSMVKPTDELKKLAKTLPPWNTDEKLNKLSEMDVGPVLLEYVRVYECALSERRDFLNILVPREFLQNSSTGTRNMGRENYNDTMDDQNRTIDNELAISREALNRTLMILGGEDRLRPLSLDIECLKRVSLDIRNILGLVSQASACMPRVRDARGSLRDLPDPTAGP